MALGSRLRLLRERARGRVSVAGPVELGPGVRFDAGGAGRIELGSGVRLGRGTRLHAAGGRIDLGAGTALGERCEVVALESVRVGERCTLGDEVVLVDADPVYADAERPIREQGVATAPVAIGPGVSFGPGACVMAGVTVGAGARVGPHAVVARDVAPGEAALGVPAHRPDGPASEPTSAARRD